LIATADFDVTFSASDFSVAEVSGSNSDAGTGTASSATGFFTVSCGTSAAESRFELPCEGERLDNVAPISLGISDCLKRRCTDSPLSPLFKLWFLSENEGKSRAKTLRTNGPAQQSSLMTGWSSQLSLKTWCHLRPATGPALYVPRRTMAVLNASRMSEACCVDRGGDWREALLLAMGYSDPSYILRDESDDDGEKPRRGGQALLRTQSEDLTSTTTGSSSSPRRSKRRQRHSLKAMVAPVVLNLLGKEPAAAPIKSSIDDNWLATARAMLQSLDEMISWIQQKHVAFVGLVDSMSDNDASLVSSSVTNFIATTANEIENLRQLIQTGETTSPTMLSPQAVQHRTGIIQVLLYKLRQEIANPFNHYQKQRKRLAVKLWHHPYQCQIVDIVASRSNKRRKSDNDNIMGFMDQDADVDDNESMDRILQQQRFMPNVPSHRMQHNYLATYEDPRACRYFGASKNTELRNQRPVSIFDRSKRASSSVAVEQKVPQPRAPDPTIAATSSFTSSYNPVQQEEEWEHEAVLLRETLTASTADLDNVQKMESMMTNITRLLSQFSDMVSEQQEAIQMIADSTVDTKSNVEKGTDQLLQAADRTHHSHHYQAKGIFLLSLILLLLHWLRA
jgi:hypothetical protein